MSSHYLGFSSCRIVSNQVTNREGYPHWFAFIGMGVTSFACTVEVRMCVFEFGANATLPPPLIRVRLQVFSRDRVSL